MPSNPVLAAPTSAQSRVAPRLAAEEITPVQHRKPRVTVENAVEAYLADARSQEIESSTLSKLETIFCKQFLVWRRIEGIDYLDQIDLDTLVNFRNTWKDGKLAKQKQQSRLIGFFWACVRRGYIAQNPCMGLDKIKVVQIPTDYFPRDEFQRILDATHVYGDPRGGFIPIEDLRTRLRTMTLLMRWSGLRICDTITFDRHHVQRDSLLLYQAKTGTPIYVPLPPYLVKALDNVPPGPKPNPRYFFYRSEILHHGQRQQESLSDPRDLNDICNSRRQWLSKSELSGDSRRILGCCAFQRLFLGAGARHQPGFD